MEEELLMLLQQRASGQPDEQIPVMGDDLLGDENPEVMAQQLEQEFGRPLDESNPVETARALLLKRMKETRSADEAFQQKTNADNRMRLRENAALKVY